jgi:hypothetical protein
MNGPSPAPALVAWAAVACFANELLLAATHLKVLMCIGRPLSARELSSKRWTYFLHDAMSPLYSLAAARNLALSPAPTATQQQQLLAPLLLLVAAHVALHVFYIATWHRQHARHVVQMSAVRDMRSRCACAYARGGGAMPRVHKRHALAPAAGQVSHAHALHAPHTRRWQRFGAREVAWFLAGTSYDIGTHAAMMALLGRQLLAAAAGGGSR